ncbi:hypothetical protein [Brevibacillus fortis]|uniref:Uncharacterized protein n=1 Tax=Brevibacillus fortis TaxID=2126352 RepID=A0A2P7VKZ5_9BACL|nr:hypothetical protein [Brevibacillus fortis]PSJ99893.1 hypothetical protein C7R93_04280 [Brevibacillus fortis]
MCLELIVMIKETPGFEPKPLLSPYVLSGKLSRENSPHFFKRFPKRQGWWVTTEEGCACRFSISKHPDKVKLGMYPEEERPRHYQRYVEDYQKSMTRMMQLRAWCEELLDHDKTQVELYGLWMGDKFTKREPIYATIEHLFSPKKFRIDEQHYILTR